MGQFESIRFLSGRPLLRELSADRLNTILQEIKRNKPKGERGITVRQDGNQTWIGLAASLPRGTPATRQPWDLIARIDPDNENQYLVKVQPGKVSNFVATNWNAEFALSKTQTYYAFVEIATDQQAITSLEIKMETSPPAGQQPALFALPDPVKIVFGIFRTGTALRTIPDGNIELQPRVWFQEARTGVAAGESLYNLYYVLAP